MKKIITNCFVFILILSGLLSGCGNNNAPDRDSSGKENTIEYKSGVIMLKTDEVYNMTDQERNSEEQRQTTEDINFGPGNIEFGN